MFKILQSFELLRLRKVLKKEKTKFELFFIITSGRSGSTILRKTLMEKYEVHIAPESEEFIIEAGRVYLKEYSWERRVKRIINVFENSGINKLWGIDLKKVESKILEFPLEDQTFTGIIKEFYKEQSIRANNQSSIMGDKSPILSLKLKWLKIIYPKAKYIHLVRNGFDVALSRMENFNEDIDQAASRWIWAENEFFKNKKGLDYITVFYEDLVLNNQNEIERVALFLGLNSRKQRKKIRLEDEILRHHKKIKLPLSKIVENKTIKSDERIYLLNKFKKIKNREIINRYFKLNY